MINTSFKELLIIAAKEIYEDKGESQDVKDKLNNFLSTLQILDSLLIKDDIGLRSIEHYYLNGKYAAYTGTQVLVLTHFYNEVDNIDNITTTYSTIKAYIEAQCNL